MVLVSLDAGSFPGTRLCMRGIVTSSNSSCLAFVRLQDSAVIEQHRQAVFASDSDAIQHRSSSGNAEAPISGQDYEKLRQWKDAAGAPTFAALQKRRDR